MTQTSISLNVKSLRWNRKFLILIFLITISVASSALGAIYAMIYYIKPTEGQANNYVFKSLGIILFKIVTISSIVEVCPLMQ